MPQNSRKLIESLSLDYEILHDPFNRIAADYGLRWTFPEDLKALYLQFGINLTEANGEDSWTSALPARYLIDTSGTIRYLRANADYTHRPEPQETLEAVQRLVDEG